MYIATYLIAISNAQEYNTARRVKRRVANNLLLKQCAPRSVFVNTKRHMDTCHDGCMNPVGLHHFTAIVENPQENLTFYRDVLGMRFVKKSVNQDDPRTYHFFFGDYTGRPGSTMTFFPWTHTGRKPGRAGAGVTQETMLSIPEGSTQWWKEHLRQNGVQFEPARDWFEEVGVTFKDPSGFVVSLIEQAVPVEFTVWPKSVVPEAHQIHSLYGARLPSGVYSDTILFLEQVLGYARTTFDDEWARLRISGQPGVLDIRMSHEKEGTWGVGTLHHIALSAESDAHARQLLEKVRAYGIATTELLDRHWFKSFYFTEPGGVVFEIATRRPGFDFDEPLETLGETLTLPPRFEKDREKIQEILEPVT